MVEAVDIWMGGTVGKDAHLGSLVMEKIPCEDLKPIMMELLIKHFGASPKQQVVLV